MRIYLDGVFDLFHRGHMESFKTVKKLYPNCTLVVGVVTDKTCESYKRTPIIHEEDRLEMIKGVKYIDEIIFPAPLYMSPEFLKRNIFSPIEFF